MAEVSTTASGKRVPNRVTYQGITYTICTRCYDVIGSGKAEASLVIAESTHHCAAMGSESMQEDVNRI